MERGNQGLCCRGFVRRIAYRIGNVAIAPLAALALTCATPFNDPAPEPAPALAKLVPVTVAASSGSVDEVWSLFDRSTSTGWQPPAEQPTTLTIGLDGEHTVALLKVFGPAPFELSLARADGTAIAGATFDLQSLDEGWNHLPVPELPVLSTVQLHLVPQGATAPLPEIEIWSSDDSESLPRTDDGLRTAIAASDDLEGLTHGAASPAEAVLSLLGDAEGSSCATFTLVLAQDPATWRRAYLVYEAENVFRSFALRRGINGAALEGGAWITSFAGRQRLIDPIDPELLELGDNEVALCLPEDATMPVTLRSVHLVGEPERGSFGESAVIQPGADARDGWAALDGDAATSAALAAGESLLIEFERLVAPDAIALSPPAAAAAAWEARCRTADGSWQPIEVTEAGGVLAMEGDQLACAALSLAPAQAVEVAEIAILGSGARERIDWPKVTIASPAEHFGKVAWVAGWASAPSLAQGPVRVAVDGGEVESVSGEFGRLVVRSADATGPWSVDVSARFSTSDAVTRTVVLSQDASGALDEAVRSGGAVNDLAERPHHPWYGNEGDEATRTARRQKGAKIRLGSRVGVDIPAGAVNGPKHITVRHLGRETVPRLDPGLINVTAPRGHAYEFLPHGQRFNMPVEVLVPFDASLLPEGNAPTDVYTYYYDPKARAWERLGRAAVDLGESTVRSRTDHFTVMINAVLAVPESPRVLSYDPTSVSSLAAASPAANVDLIEPPIPDSSGEARLSLPIRLPPGRGAFQPGLALSYVSSGGNSWMGVGWDMPVSKIEIDSRWGVPTYEPGEEPRYVLDGEPIVPVAEAEGPNCQNGGNPRRYRARVEGAFRHILRCGPDPAHYHFEVHDRSGTLYIYGDVSQSSDDHASLADYADERGVFAFHLAKVRDVHGNITRFTYQADEGVGDANHEAFTALYPASIRYTSHPSASTAPYRVDCELDDGTRLDRIISGRPGFKTVTRKLLRSIKVSFADEVIRQYVLSYERGQFAKARLTGVRVYGVGGCAAAANAFGPVGCPDTNFFHEHRFDYYDAPELFADPVAWDVHGDPAPERATLGKGLTRSNKLSISGGTPGGTFAVSANRAWGDRNELVGIYDVDGNGLPDQVLARDEGLVFLYNQFHPELSATDPLFSTTGPSVSALEALSHEKHDSWSGGVTLTGQVGPISASVSGGIASSTTRADRILTDIDGDGFVDRVGSDGELLRGRPCPTGFCFEAGSFATVTTIDPRSDSLLEEADTEIAERLLPGDPVLQWVAPFGGRIAITGEARKQLAGGDDGVSVELFYQDSLLESAELGPDDTDPVALPGSQLVLDVSRGDALYVRVRTGDDDGIDRDLTLRDRVDAHISVVYRRVCEGLSCTTISDPEAAVEPTRRPLYQFDSREDFRIAGRPVPLVAPAGGTLVLDAILHKQPSAAPVRACVQKFPVPTAGFFPELDAACDDPATDATNLSGTLAFDSGETASQPFTLSIPVALGEMILFRVESDLSFDPADVALARAAADQPMIAYSEVCVPQEDATVPCSSDPEVLADVPLVEGYFGAFVDLVDTPPLRARRPFIAPHDGDLYIDVPTPAQAHLFAVRSSEQGVLLLRDCRLMSCPALDLFTASVSQGESLTFEILTQSGFFAATVVPVSYTVDFSSQVFAAPLHVRTFVHGAGAQTPFAGGYRGFHAGIWNDREDFEPAQLLVDLDNPFLTQERREQIARSMVTPAPLYRGAAFTGSQPAWVGPGSLAFVSADSLHAARVGAAGTGPDGEVVDGGSVFADSYLRLSGSRSFFIGAGVQFYNVAGINLSTTFSSTRTTTDIVDINGDGVADVIADGGTRGGVIGTLVGELLPGLTLGGGFRKRDGKDYAIDFGAGAFTRPTYTSTGRAFAQDSNRNPSTGVLGTSVGIGFGVGRSQATHDLIDLNGDGLPDRVRRDGPQIKVALNLGSSFGTEETFGQVEGALLTTRIDGFQTFEDNTPGLNSTEHALGHDTVISRQIHAGLSLVFVSFSASKHASASRTTRQVTDVNGDGLADLVFKKEGQDMQVQLNRGGDFAAPTPWPTPGWNVPLDTLSTLEVIQDLGVTGPDVLAATNRQSGTELGFSINLGIFSAGASRSSHTDSYELALLDIDGDGDADHVLRRGQEGDPGSIHVKENRLTGKGNLLRRINRPLGGSITLDYERTRNTVDLPQMHMVLARIEVDDGANLGANFASPNLVTTAAYEDGFYDRGEKEFFGFAKVTVKQAPGTAVEQRVERLFHNRSYPLRRHIRRETLRNVAGGMFTDRELTYEVRDVVDAGGTPLAAQSDCLSALHPLLTSDACRTLQVVQTEEVSRHGEGGSLHKDRLTQDLVIDRFGSTRTFLDHGDDTTTTDDVHAQTEYLNDTSRWILGMPTSIVVRAGGPAGALLRSRTGTYSSLGDLEAVHVHTGTSTATTLLAYDPFGNLHQATTPPNLDGQSQGQTFVYDAIAHRYVTSVTDAFGYSSLATYDLRFGEPTSSTDANAATMTRTYDAFGRLKTVAGPYDPGTPLISIDYFHEEGRPRAVTTNRSAPPADFAGPAVPADIRTVIVVDGLGRVVQTRKTATVGGVPGMTTQLSPSFDELGRVTVQYHPLFTAGASDEFLSTPPAIPPATLFAFDVLNRNVSTTYPDAVGVESIDRTIFRIEDSPDGHPMLVANFAAANGVKRETFTDLLGRTVALKEHPSSGDEAITRYRYLPTGELAGITDAEGNVSTLGHDLRGLLLTIDNPDTGLIEQQYDLQGNVIAHVEPNHRAAGVVVRFRYERDRLVAVDYPSKPDVAFEYGPPGAPNGRAGRLARVTDETGYQEHFYGSLGEIRRTVRLVDPRAPGRQPVVFDTRSTYDSLGRLLELVYPDGEVLSHVYDAGGNLRSVTGAGSGWSRTYVSQLTYDVFGNRTHALYDNDVEASWSYDPRRIRLQAATTTLPSNARIQDLRYAYDKSSNPTLIDSLLPIPGPSSDLPGSGSLSLSYDGVDRLVRAQGTTSLAPQKSTAYDQRLSYSSSHNLLSKQREHVVTQPSSIEVFPADTNIDLPYFYDGPRPHAPTQVGDLLLTYDPSGNTTERRKQGTGSMQRLFWDDDGRLIEVQQSGGNQRNFFDAEGNRVLRRDRHGETIFANRYFDLQHGSHGIKHVFAGPFRVASVLTHAPQANDGQGGTPHGHGGTPPGQGGTPPGQGGGTTDGPIPPPQHPGHAFFFHPDHLSSTSVLTDEDGTVHEHTQYFADGEVWIDRGPQQPVNGYLFSGKPFDPDTGFYDFGQRFYDPRTSLWLGVDPAFGASPAGAIGDPVDLSLYAFVGHSPLRMIDGDGAERDWGDPEWRQKQYAKWKNDSSPPTSVGRRVGGAFKVIGGGAGFVTGAGLCETIIGCVIGAPLMVASADVAGSGAHELVSGGAEPTVIGQAFGSKAQEVEEAIVGGAGLAGGVARPVSPVPAKAPSSGVWAMKPFDRGVAIENSIGRNLPGNFPTIDRFRGGIATSIKSVDLTAKTYQNPSTLLRTVAGYIHEVRRFNGATWADFEVAGAAIRGRALELAIPAGSGSAAQNAALQFAVKYGRMFGVRVTIIPF